MAYQHFYSRVPARMSMFNRTDGYDTFACSNEITQEFIEKELSAVYGIKPMPDELTRIRKGQLPPVYIQYFSRSGKMIQSCISYIPSDYTGERSSYFVHSLVFSEEETVKILYNPDNVLLTKDMLCSDISVFDITSPDMKPDPGYPEKDYIPDKTGPTSQLLTKLDANNAKRLIYALLACACGKLKSIFFIYPDPTPDNVLFFINTIMQIIPYHLRRLISFSTMMGESSRLSQIKLRCIPPDISAVTSSRGTVFNLRSKTVTGLRDIDIANNIQVVDFFYNMLINDTVRREFLTFTDKAVNAIPSLGSAGIKQISDLVFMFRAGCGKYDEKTVLPNDDKILEFLTIYEKCRNAMSDEFRINSLVCIKRYSEKHLAIPKQVFAKIQKLYPSELPGVKRVIMGVILELIHTDIMRDKLLAFLKSNYNDEDTETQKTIISDLCRVFYGGFLQPQIISFFTGIFPDAAEESQNLIMEKLLLALRTKSIQPQIFEFIRQFYPILCPESKRELYNAILENMSYGDYLTEYLMAFTDEHINTESDDFITWFSDELSTITESEQRRKEHPLLQLLVTDSGFCGKITARNMFSIWSSRKIFAEYINLICDTPLTRMLDLICKMWEYNPDMTEAVSVKFLRQIEENTSGRSGKSDVFDMINSENVLTQRVGKSGNPAAKDFCMNISEKLIQPAICNSLYSVLKHTELDDAIGILNTYIDSHPKICECPRYIIISAYTEIKTCVANSDSRGLIAAIDKFPEDATLRKNTAGYMKKDLSADIEKSTGEFSILLSVLINYLGTGTYGFNLIYSEMLSAGTGEKPASSEESWQRECKSLQILINTTVLIFSLSHTQQMKDLLYSESSGLSDCLSSFISKWGKRAKRQLTGIIDSAGVSANDSDNEFIRYLHSLEQKNKPEKQGFFSRLFGKK